MSLQYRLIHTNQREIQMERITQILLELLRLNGGFTFEEGSLEVIEYNKGNHTQHFTVLIHEEHGTFGLRKITIDINNQITNIAVLWNKKNRQDVLQSLTS